jgi:tubulin epsilon
MTQTVVIQVGQCGNQIGCQFWERALGEHAAFNRSGTYDAALASLFRNVDTRYSPARELAAGDGRGPVASLRARSVLIDMEEGVVSGLQRGRLGELFDPQHCVTSVSGSGNNWAVGFYGYGSRYGEDICEVVRKATELCDCLQSFLLLHSMGGGTGSGLGTHVLTMLRDEYPDVYRFVTAVYPSEVRGWERVRWGVYESKVGRPLDSCSRRFKLHIVHQQTLHSGLGIAPG